MKRLFVIICLVSRLFAADPVKPPNPNKVQDFSDIQSRIFRKEMLENFEEKAIEEIFLSPDTQATVRLSRELAPPVTETIQYASVNVATPETRRVRLQFRNPPEIKSYCRALTFWLNVEKLHARLSLIVEDREGRRHFLDSGELQFRGWRFMRLSVPQKVHQQDWYLDEKSALKLIGIEIVFARKYTKGKLPLILIDEIAAEVRDKYQVPPPLKK
ncbi:MAG: hypothetical protein JNJ69_08605 [Leptospiraceae bacterium]|nr:hypothetical protein [Leptospiraceae bacterium]